MRLRRIINNVSTSLFTKPVALVIFAPCDEITDGWVLIEQPSLMTSTGVTFITGHHAAQSAACIRGRRVLIPIHCVTSITEYDTTADVWETPKRKRRGRK
jgi:hypothetical protein